MMSIEAQRELFSQESGQYPIILLTIDHPELADPIRISTDPTQRLDSWTTDEEVYYGTVSNGYEYFYFPVSVAWPTEDEESPPQTTLTVSNIRRELTATVRELATSPTLQLSLVLSGDVDTVESEFSGFVLQDITIETLTVKGSLTIDTGATEPYPYLTFTPSTSPGSFKS